MIKNKQAGPFGHPGSTPGGGVLFVKGKLIPQEFLTKFKEYLIRFDRATSRGIFSEVNLEKSEWGCKTGGGVFSKDF